MSESECSKARGRVCGVCTRKAPNMRPISAIVLRMILDYHYDSYNTEEFPHVICVSCDQTLRYIDKLEDDEEVAGHLLRGQEGAHGDPSLRHPVLLMLLVSR